MRKLRAFFSILTALTLLVSSIGFSVSRHYCLGMLAEQSFYHLGDETCGMEGDFEDTCDFSGQQIGSQCCEDQNFSVAGLEIQERETQASKEIVNQELVLFQAVYNPELTGRTARLHKTPAYGPPDGICPDNHEILIHLQRFLI